MKNRKLVTGYIIVILLVFAGFLYSYATSGEPGTSSDPLVTKSYVDLLIDNIDSRLTAVEDIIDELKTVETTADSIDENTSNTELPEDLDMEAINQYIETKVAEITNDGFVVVQCQEGQRLIAGESTEIIVRSGSASVVGNESGDGIADVTSGRDIKDGESVTLNHLLIVPRADERGLFFESGSYIMIKGDYTIK